MAPHRQRAPAVDFPPSPTPRVHHTSVLDSPVQPAPVHELSRIFAAVSLHSTADNESATSTPDIRSPLKFRQRPGPRKKGAAEAPRWIPPPTATPSRAKRPRTVAFKLGVLAWAHHTRMISKAGKPLRKQNEGDRTGARGLGAACTNPSRKQIHRVNKSIAQTIHCVNRTKETERRKQNRSARAWHSVYQSIA